MAISSRAIVAHLAIAIGLRAQAHASVAPWSLLPPMTMMMLLPRCSSFSATLIAPRAGSRTVRAAAADATAIGEEDSAEVVRQPDDDDGFFPSDLLEAAARASVPKAAETETGAHDAFRYEWGRWVDDASVEELMDEINDLQLPRGYRIYDRLLEVPTELSTAAIDDGVETATAPDDAESSEPPRRFRVAGGNHWDCLLHVLPKGTEWRGRWPTGSWAIARALTGMAETNLIRGPDRDGFFKKATTAKLRGGGDGTLGGGGGRGEDCVKHVGGALRGYSGSGGKTLLLEVVIRPPNGSPGVDGDGLASSDIEAFPSEDPVLAAIQEEEEEAPPEQSAPAGETATEPEPPSAPAVADESEGGRLGAKMGLVFDKVGGLDDQLDDIVRRVLASRANPELARKFGVNHVRGILLSGPPGCGKTLLARELSALLGAREPQIVNGPEILDKFIGEAEKNVRALFRPAEIEYEQVGDASALHVIVLDELDAIARRRGSVSGDSTGVRDSVVNQLLSKMDGVREANNVLVIGLTNRPELLDPALTRPGRLEVQLRVELPDAKGRRDILRIHTRHMRAEGGIDSHAWAALEDVETDRGIPARTEHFTGAELAGLVRSAASFAIARAVDDLNADEPSTMVGMGDFERALSEVRPALGKQDDVLESRFPYGISPCSESMRRLMRDIGRFTSTPGYLAEHRRNDGTPGKSSPALQSLLLVGDGHTGGTGATALACWAASEASAKGDADFVRLVTALDLLGDSGDESARATAMVERFAEASQMSGALLVFDDIDQICAGRGPGGYSSLMVSTLRALLRSPAVRTSKASSDSTDLNGGIVEPVDSSKSLSVIASTSRTDALCTVLHELFDEALVVPELSDAESLRRLFSDSIGKMGSIGAEVEDDTLAEMAKLTVDSVQTIGCKTALRILERTVATSFMTTSNNRADSDGDWTNEVLLSSLRSILDDYLRDKDAAQKVDCKFE